MLQNTKSGLAVVSREVEILSNYTVYEYSRNLNAMSKYILFTSECTGSNSLTTKIDEVPVIHTDIQHRPFLSDTDTISNFALICLIACISQ